LNRILFERTDHTKRSADITGHLPDEQRDDLRKETGWT
jgi:hypothetical protein